MGGDLRYGELAAQHAKNIQLALGQTFRVRVARSRCSRDRGLNRHVDTERCLFLGNPSRVPPGVGISEEPAAGLGQQSRRLRVVARSSAPLGSASVSRYWRLRSLDRRTNSAKRRGGITYIL